jgi:dynein heavy chain
MSEIVGFDLTPDSGTTLRKVLKLNLTPYLEKFEVISAGASKVSMNINQNTLLDEFVNLIIIVLWQLNVYSIG